MVKQQLEHDQVVFEYIEIVSDEYKRSQGKVSLYPWMCTIATLPCEQTSFVIVALTGRILL